MYILTKQLSLKIVFICLTLLMTDIWRVYPQRVATETTPSLDFEYFNEKTIV